MNQELTPQQLESLIQEKNRILLCIYSCQVDGQLESCERMITNFVHKWKNANIVIPKEEFRIAIHERLDHFNWLMSQPGKQTPMNLS